MSAVVVSLFLSLAAPAPAVVSTPPCAGVASLAPALSNPRLPLGRLRTLPSGALCPPPTTQADPAPQPEPQQPVTVVVVRELIVRPSQVIIEPPEIHFVDELPAAASTQTPTP